tara:strand:+ start:18322 stop:18705 length:384 start_codon:yes stop_codon:yes gene_type:complete
MSKEVSARCTWSPNDGYRAETPFGVIPMFDGDGHRAVELMLLSAVSCLNFFLVEYAKTRNYEINVIECSCDKEIVQRPERIGTINIYVNIDGNVNTDDKDKMVEICERSCKVMNTIKNTPICNLVIQ